MSLDSFSDLRAYVLKRADEDAADTAGDFYDIVSDLAADVQRDLITRHPWLDLVKDTPGVLLTADDVTGLTITIAAAGTSVAATLSSGPSVDLDGYKVRPTTKQWSARISGHTAAGTAITLDAAPEALSAVSCVIYKDEYELASDLGVFVDGLWDQNGHFVPLKSQEELKAAFPDPAPSGNPATLFARLTRRKIRLSEYPTEIRRYEYPYVAEIADPSGSSDLALPPYLRRVLAEGVLALLYDLKLDKRHDRAATRYETGIARAIAYESQRVQGLGLLSNRMRQGGYSDRARGGYGA